MTEPRVARLAGLACASALLVVVMVSTPWTPLAGVPASDPATDFGPTEIARAAAFRSEVLVWSTLSWALSVLVPVVVGCSALGRWLVSAIGGRRWYVVVPQVVIVVGLAANLLTLPAAVVVERAMRRWGLSTQDWGSWGRDRAVAWALGAVALTALALLLVGLARRWRSWWWVPGGLAVAGLLVAVSFGYPLLVEARFNEFVSMPAGALREDLLRLAATDGVRVSDVLVADASRRTTSLNAYVSGFGATRRIVVYDTLLNTTPDQVRLVVAHELGHARHDDVLHGTLIGALAAMTAVILLRLVVGARVADPNRIALLLALVAIGGTAVAPAKNLVSRRIETRADVHALELTRDPAGLAALQHGLAVANVSALDPAPWRFAMFASHPTPPQRIEVARSWGDRHGIAVPPLARR